MQTTARTLTAGAAALMTAAALGDIRLDENVGLSLDRSWQPDAAAQASETEPSPGETRYDENGIPIVQSREDFFNLSRRDRAIFGRSRRPPITVLTGLNILINAPTDTESGSEVSVARISPEIGLSFRVSDEADLIFQFVPEISTYDFDGDIIPGVGAEPFDDVFQLEWRVAYRYQQFEGWSYIIGGQITSSAEPGAEFGDSLAGGGFFTVSYQINERLSLGIGGAFTTRLEGGIFGIAFPIINYQITDAFRIGTTQRGLGFFWEINEAWSFSTTLTFLRREYRLEENGSPLSGGSVTDFRLPVAAALTYAPTQRFVFSGSIGVDAGGARFEFNDADQNEIRTEDVDTGLFGGIDVRFRF